MLLQERSPNRPNFSDLSSNIGSDAVSAFGLGNVVLSLLSGAKSVLSTLLGRSLDTYLPLDILL